MESQPTRPVRSRPVGRIRGRLRPLFREPTFALGLLTLLLFIYLIIAPILAILSDAVRFDARDAVRYGAQPGDFTLYYLWRAFASPVAVDLLWRPLLHTLSIAVATILLALVIGGSIAWLLSRTDVWGRRWFATALIVPYMLPSWTFALAWTTLFKNNRLGGQPGWLEALGWAPPDWLAYGGVPITLVFATHFSPFVILLFGNALKRFDSQLEDAARMLSASPARVAFDVILPALRPALLSGVLLIAAKVLGEFGVAYVLGLPTGFDVLSTSLYRSISARQPGLTAVVAAVIILIGVLMLIAETYFVREAQRFVTYGGKGAMARSLGLGKLRLPATIWCGAVFGVGVIVPLTVLLLSTLMRSPGVFRPDNFTLDFWIGRDLITSGFPDGVLVSAQTWHAAWNSVWIVGVAALIAGILGQIVGYVVTRTDQRWLGGMLRNVTFLPYLVPGIAFAAAYLALFSVQRGPIPALYGTAAILILILIAEQMPFSSRAGISSMMQLGRESEEAAKLFGAGWWRRLVGVVLPLQRSALATGIIMPFIAGIKGLSLVILLAVPGTELLTTLSMGLVSFGYTQAANAVVLIIALIAFSGTYLTQKLLKTDLSKGLGG